MKKSRRTYNGVHLNKKSNTQDVVEQSLTYYISYDSYITALYLPWPKDIPTYRFFYMKSIIGPVLLATNHLCHF